MSEMKALLTYDHSGVTGNPGIPGTHGKSKLLSKNGGDGACGQGGGRGSDGIPISIGFSQANSKIVFTDLSTPQKIQKFLPLGKANSKIDCFSIGGTGGIGGRGGDGHNGERGSNGRDATEYSSAGNGGDGGDGGDGGVGGPGGPGGRGGDITFFTIEEDMDLFMTIQNLANAGGQGGKGGGGGTGGIGGPGGYGGDGLKIEVTRGGQHQETIRKSPGSHGSHGSSGNQGSSGPRGPNGENGIVRYIINNRNYSTRYNPRLQAAESALSAHGVAEPGDSLEIKILKIQNFSDMPTPIHQPILISINNSKWVRFDSNDCVPIPRSIPAKQIVSIEKPLKYKINDFLGTMVGDPLDQKAELTYAAELTRVNQKFEHFNEDPFPFQVRFPVEMSSVIAQRSITIDEESPFAVSIWNRSKKPIGIKTKEGRLLNFRLILLDHREFVEFYPKVLTQEYLKDQKNRNGLPQAKKSLNQANFITPNQQDRTNLNIGQEFILELPPNQTFTISGSIRIKDKNLPMYTKIPMQAKLDLGFVHDKQNVYQNIQSRTFHVQLTEKHMFSQEADYLLIFNSQTPSEFVNAVKTFSNAIGTRIDLWNMSNFEGFSFKHIVPEANQPIEKLYSKKVMVLLNSIYENNRGQKATALANVGPRNIYNAASESGIRTYIIGGNTEAQHSITRATGLAQQHASIIEKVSQVAETAYQKFLDQADHFSLLKLLMFERKMQIFQKAIPFMNLMQPLLTAILSDLADEFSALLFAETDRAQLQAVHYSWTTAVNFPFQKQFENALNPQQYAPPQSQQSQQETATRPKSQTQAGTTTTTTRPTAQTQIGTITTRPPAQTQSSKELNVSMDNTDTLSSLDSSQSSQNILNSQQLRFGMAPPMMAMPQGVSPKQKEDIKNVLKYVVDRFIRFRIALIDSLSFVEKYICCCKKKTSITKYFVGLIELILIQQIGETPKSIKSMTKLIRKQQAVLETVENFQMPYELLFKAFNIPGQLRVNNHQPFNQRFNASQLAFSNNASHASTNTTVKIKPKYDSSLILNGKSDQQTSAARIQIINEMEKEVKF